MSLISQYFRRRLQNSSNLLLLPSIPDPRLSSLSAKPESLETTRPDRRSGGEDISDLFRALTSAEVALNSVEVIDDGKGITKSVRYDSDDGVIGAVVAEGLPKRSANDGGSPSSSEKFERSSPESGCVSDTGTALTGSGAPSSSATSLELSKRVCCERHKYYF